jgi:hypothetical protein
MRNAMMQISSTHYYCWYSIKVDTCHTQTKRYYLQNALDAVPRSYFTIKILVVSARTAIHAAAIVLLMQLFVLSAPHIVIASTTTAGTAAAAAAVGAAGAAGLAAGSTIDTAFLLSALC